MGIERVEVVGKKSYSLISFSIGLNVFIGYLIFQIPVLIRVTIIFFSISIGLLLLRKFVFKPKVIKTSSRSITKKKTTSLMDNISLARKFTWDNRRNIFATTIGLLLALLIITQSYLISSTYQQTSFNEYIDGDDTTGFKIQFEQLDNRTFPEWDRNLPKNISKWFQDSFIKPKNSHSELNLKVRIIMGDNFNYDLYSQGIDTVYAEFLDATTHVWNENLLALYSQLPSYPGDEIYSKELLILPPLLTFSIPQTGTDFFELSDFLITNSTGIYFKLLVNVVSMLLPSTTPYTFHNITYRVDDYWQLTYEDLAYIENNNLQLPLGFYYTNLIFPNNDDVIKLYDHLLEAENTFFKNPYVWGSIGYSTLIGIELPKFKDYSSTEIKLEYEKIASEIAADVGNYTEKLEPFLDDTNVITNVITPLLILLINYHKGYEKVELLFLTFSVPLILISLFLLYFSLNTMKKKKERLFSQLILRGASNSQLRTILLFEIFVLALISAFLALVSAIPLSRLFLQSSGVFEFDKDPVEILIPNGLFWRIPIIGILISFNFNLDNLNSLSKFQIEHSLENPIEEKPLWIKYNIDLILFFVNLAIWGVLFLIHIPNSVEHQIFEVLGPFMILFSLISIPLVIGRYFLDTLAKFTLVIKRHFDLFRISISNLSTNKSFTGQLLALMSISMIITFSGLIMTNSMVNSSQNSALYNLGSEVLVEGIDYANTTLIEGISIDGVESISEARYIEYILQNNDVPYSTKPSDFPNKFLYGINPLTFSEATFWNNEFSSFSLNQIMNELKEKPQGLILPSKHAEFLGLEVGENYTFMYGPRGSRTYDFELIATVDYFPRIINDIHLNQGNGVLPTIFLIMNLETLDFLWKNRPAGSNDRELFLTFVNVKNNPQKIAKQIRSNLITLIENIEDITVKDYLSEAKPFFDFVGEDPGLAVLESDISIITLHAILLFAIIVSIAGSTFYSTVFLGSRKKEFGIYRALGMRRKQIARVIFYELSLLSLSSIVLGLFFGIFISFITFKVVLGNGQSIPPFELMIPFNEILFVTGMFLVISTLIAFVPSRSFTKAQIGNILRVN